ncbi:MAG: transposase, partial [Verrucomicrobia bacterium]|nr:transposase [Verrucomicrobiota bacterium]
MVVVDGAGVPLGSQLASASPAEVTLAESTLKKISVPQPRGRPRNRPLRVVADRGYDSDPLRWRLLRRGILLICPHRKNRTKPSLNDGRALRRYRKRWKVERTFAWLGNARLRRLLYVPALAGLQYNPVLRAQAARLATRGKPGKVRVGAVMRKLLCLCVGVLRSGQPWQDSGRPIPQTTPAQSS